MLPENNLDLGFQIQAIRVTDFAIHEQTANSPETIGFGIQIQHLWVADTEDWVVEAKVTMGSGENLPPVAELTVDCQYRLSGYLYWLQQQSDPVNKPGTLPAGLSATLNSISISTMRGILFERLLGTHWQQAILPIIDPMAFQVAKS